MHPPSSNRFARSLWGALYLALFAAVASVAWTINYARSRSQAIEYVESIGGSVAFAPVPKSRPKWLSAPQWLQKVDAISFGGMPPSYRATLPVDLRRLEALSEIETIAISGDVLEDGFESIRRFANLHDFSASRITPSQQGILQQCRQLKAVSVHASRDEDLATLVGLPVRTLVVRGPSTITDSGLSHLADSPIEVLALEKTQVTGAGFRHLAKCPLRIASFSNSPVTDIGLAELERFHRLNRLYLNDTKITDAGLNHLAALPLKILALRGTDVTDAGVQALKDMRLEILNLEETKVHPEALRGFPKGTGLQVYLSTPPWAEADIDALRRSGLDLRFTPGSASASK
jgi:hypothetical protein